MKNTLLLSANEDVQHLFVCSCAEDIEARTVNSRADKETAMLTL